MNEPDNETARIRKHLSDRYDNAVRNAAEVNRKAIDATIVGAEERTQFFEKLALGCCASLLAISSFIGARQGQHLLPSWLFRATLIALAFGASSALLRNLRFQAYRHTHWNRENASALLNRLIVEDECMRRIGGVDSDGKIDLEKWQRDFESESSVLKGRLEEFQTREARMVAEIRRLETITLLGVVATIGFVVALCWVNL